VPESTGISCGFLLAALHHAGFSTLVYPPNSMKFLKGMLGKPDSKKPVVVIVTSPAMRRRMPRCQPLLRSKNRSMKS